MAWEKICVQECGSAKSEEEWLHRFVVTDEGHYTLDLVRPKVDIMHTETVQMQQTIDRWDSLNPAFEVSSSKVLDHLRRLIRESPLILKSDGVAEVENKLHQCRIRWRFYTHPVTDLYERFWKQVLMAGLAMVPRLAAQLQAKDDEIEDYVTGGATLSRKSLKTPKFDLDATCKSVQSGSAASDPVAIVSSRECRDLFDRMSRTQGAAADASSGKKQVVQEAQQSQSGKIPASSSPQQSKSIASKIGKANPTITQRNDAKKTVKRPKFL